MRKILFTVLILFLCVSFAQAYTDMKQKSDTAANWTSYNPTLLQGQIGYETDTRNFKFGDGVTAWNSLPYAISSPLKFAASLSSIQRISTTSTTTVLYNSVDSHSTATTNYNASTGVFTVSQAGWYNVLSCMSAIEGQYAISEGYLYLYQNSALLGEILARPDNNTGSLSGCPGAFVYANTGDRFYTMVNLSSSGTPSPYLATSSTRLSVQYVP